MTRLDLDMLIEEWMGCVKQLREKFGDDMILDRIIDEANELKTVGGFYQSNEERYRWAIKMARVHLSSGTDGAEQYEEILAGQKAYRELLTK